MRRRDGKTQDGDPKQAAIFLVKGLIEAGALEQDAASVAGATNDEVEAETDEEDQAAVIE